MTTTIGLILETIMLRLLQPTSRTYVKTVKNVKIDDALTELDTIRSNLYGRQVEAGQHKYEPYIINYINFFVYL